MAEPAVSIAASYACRRGAVADEKVAHAGQGLMRRSMSGDAAAADRRIRKAGIDVTSTTSRAAVTAPLHAPSVCNGAVTTLQKLNANAI